MNYDTSSSATQSTFDKYLEAKSRIASLEEERDSLYSETQHAQQQLVHLLLTVTDPVQNQRVQSLASLVLANNTRVADIVSNK